MPLDQELIDRICRNDAQAFEELFGRYEESICAYLVRTVRDKDVADDLLQEVFLRVWQRADQYNGNGSVAGWLFRIARNLALNSIRDRRRRKEKPLQPSRFEEEGPGEQSSIPSWMIEAATLGPDAVVEYAEQRELLQQLVNRLPEEQRDVLHLVGLGGMGMSKISQELGIPEGTVKSRLHYGRRHLAREWRRIANKSEDENEDKH